MFNKKKNMMKNNITESKPNNIVSGTTIKGEVITNGDFRIDGTLIGSINCKGKIVIGQTGTIEGEVICQNADIDSLYSWLNTTRDTIDAPVLRNHDITRLSYNESHGPSRLMLVLVAAQRKGWFKRISPLSEGWDWQPGDSAQLDATLWDTCVDARIVGHGRIAKQSSSSVPALQAQLQALQRENRALRAHNEELSAENCILRPWYITGLGELLDLRT